VTSERSDGRIISAQTWESTRSLPADLQSLDAEVEDQGTTSKTKPAKGRASSRIR